MDMKRIFLPLAAILTLSGCAQLTQATANIVADWDKHFGAPVDPDRLHIYNFDTFVCDAARQIIVSFHPTGNKASLMFEETQIMVTREAPSLPFTHPPYAMYIMNDGTLLLEKHNDVVYKHCRPLVNDPVVDHSHSHEYEFTPTITPEEAKGDRLFREEMAK